MCLKSGFLLIGLLLLSSLVYVHSWSGLHSDEPLARLSPASAGMAAVSGRRFGDYDTGGLRDESYLAIPRGPEWLSDVARIDSVARQHQAMAVVVEPETEERPQPTTRGALRVYVTHYSAPIGATIASEHPAGFRPGICATYAVRDETRRIVGAHLPGHGPVAFGTVVVVDGITQCEVWDTGTGYADSRAWVDVAVASEKMAQELGAGWREVEVLEGGSHD